MIRRLNKKRVFFASLILIVIVAGVGYFIFKPFEVEIDTSIPAISQEEESYYETLDADKKEQVDEVANIQTDYFIERFKEQAGREPTPEEIEYTKDRERANLLQAIKDFRESGVSEERIKEILEERKQEPIYGEG